MCGRSSAEPFRKVSRSRPPTAARPHGPLIDYFRSPYFGFRRAQHKPNHFVSEPLSCLVVCSVTLEGVGGNLSPGGSDDRSASLSKVPGLGDVVPDRLTNNPLIKRPRPIKKGITPTTHRRLRIG